MQASDWEKIKKNWEELTCDVLAYEILPRLHQKNVLTEDEKYYFEQLQGRKRFNMEELYHHLKEKPSKTKAFECLLECLEEDGLYKSLALKLRNTKTTTDPSLVCKVDPSYNENAIREILNAHYMNKEGTELQMKRVREGIRKCGGFSGGCEWSNKRLEGFLCQHFGDVKITKRKEKQGLRNETVWYVQNLCEKQQQEKEVEKDLSSGTSKDVFDIKALTPIELKSFLQSHFEEQGLPLESLDFIEQDGISGTVFLSLTESELEKFIPKPFGARRVISIIIKEYTEISSLHSSRPEEVREYDANVESGDFYVEGNCVKVDIQARGKRTSRIKNFHSVVGNQTETEKIEYIAVQVVLFAAACMNERRNGTIYFGINPEKTQNHQVGEVCGISVIKEELQKEVNSLLDKTFHEHHKTTIQCTVRPAKFVPVHNKAEQITTVKQGRKGEKYVIEYDIVPNSDVLKEETFKIRLKKIPHLFKKIKLTDCIVRFSESGNPKILNEAECYEFETDKAKICSQRKTDESVKLQKPPSNLRQMLQNLLTAGNAVIEDDVFVVLGPAGDLEQDAILSNVSFLKHLHPEVIFDFDCKGSRDSIYHCLTEDENLVTRVLTVDNFKAKGKEMKEIDELTHKLGKEKHTCWIFCNGYEELQMLPLQSIEWNKNKKYAFNEALRSFLKIVHMDNVLVLVCLFSKDNEVVVEASEVILSALSNQWILLAENDKIANVWLQTMLDRKRIEKSDAEERCVIGMAWSQINQCISDWCNKEEVVNVQIPQSYGNQVNVAEKTINSWCDIEVVSSSDPVLGDSKDDKYLQKVKKVEEEFYRGAQVKWLNFWYHDQVFVREVHDDLKENVVNALETQRKDEEVKIIPVYLHHQPGAGGTTSAKQILWCLKKKYRCCVVKDVTDQTCTQLREFYLYNDNNPRPILVLLDNEDEEKFQSLQADLDQVTHDLQTRQEEELNVFCVLLICMRCPEVPPAKRNKKTIFLKQKLLPKELAWFQLKSEELETRFSNDRNRNINPEFLISFNILKENFDQNYIRKVVSEFTNTISSAYELRLLKYVSLLNAHDVSFRPIPLVCLTRILSQHSPKDHEYNIMMANTWEINMSQGLKVLLNVATKKKGHIPTTVRVFHKLIASEVLKSMEAFGGQSESEIMNELLYSIFEDEDRDSKEMQRIVTNVIRKRPYKDDNSRKKEPFSYLILSVMKNEGHEKAIEILEHLHSFDNDPFTAQLIARWYIEMRNFPEAEQYAKSATDKLSSNSFLWDTYGQVYKNQLAEKCDYLKSLLNKSDVTQNDISQSLELFQKAVFYFKKEQVISEDERNAFQGTDNFAGYFNELRCILLLLSCLENSDIFSSREALHNYLVNEKVIEGTKTLQKLLTREQRKCVESLYSSSKETIQKLEEETLQRKSKFSPEMFEGDSFFQDYTSLKSSLDDFFGETSEFPQHVCQSEEEMCRYRYRRARTKGATSLRSLLDLSHTGDYEKLLKDLYDNWLLPNVTSNFCCFEYLIAILNVVVMLCMKRKISYLSFGDVLSWSRQLYTADRGDERNPALEKYLYFILFHFPTNERKRYPLASSFEMESAINKWESAYNMKYHKKGKNEKTCRKETTLFFLGRGNPLNDIVYQESLSNIMSSHSRIDKWYLPEVSNLLRPMNGILLEGGHKIKYFFETNERNTHSLTIRTSYPVRQPRLYQKKVFFFVGFSFSGPKAYGISGEIHRDLGEAKQGESKTQNPMRNRRDCKQKPSPSFTRTRTKPS